MTFCIKIYRIKNVVFQIGGSSFKNNKGFKIKKTEYFI